MLLVFSQHTEDIYLSILSILLIDNIDIDFLLL